MNSRYVNEDQARSFLSDEQKARIAHRESDGMTLLRCKAIVNPDGTPLSARCLWASGTGGSFSVEAVAYLSDGTPAGWELGPVQHVPPSVTCQWSTLRTA